MSVCVITELGRSGIARLDYENLFFVTAVEVVVWGDIFQKLIGHSRYRDFQCCYGVHVRTDLSLPD